MLCIINSPRPIVSQEKPAVQYDISCQGGIIAWVKQAMTVSIMTLF